MRDKGNWEACSARKGHSQIGVWQSLASLNQAIIIIIFIILILILIGIIIIIVIMIIISNYQFSETQAMQTKFFIESPPLAGIFAECEWMDWISKQTMMMLDDDGDDDVR